MTNHNTSPQRSQEWFAARKGRVTGSISGAILGVAPYMTREQAMRAMVRSYHGAETEFTGNIATEYGTNNEANAVAQFEMESGLDVQEVGFFAYEDWLGASPDGLCSDGHGLEVKCPFGLRNGGEFKTAKDQPHYYAQMQLEMLCAGWSGMWFYQWSPHGSSTEFIEYDQAWFDDNLPVLRQFYAEYLSELDNPAHLEPLRVELNTAETRRMIDEIDQLKEAEDNAKERRKEIQDSLIEMAKGQNALIWGRKLTKVDSKGSISAAAILKDHPEIDGEKYRGKGSSSWRLS